MIVAWNALADGRDPTLPGILPQSPQTGIIQPEANLNLTAILITETGKHAIINGITLKPGQYLNDETRLLRIQPGRVIVKQRGTLETLTLVPSVKKQLK